MAEFLLSLSLLLQVPPFGAALTRTAWDRPSGNARGRRNPGEGYGGYTVREWIRGGRRTEGELALCVCDRVASFSCLRDLVLFLQFREIACCRCIGDMQEFLDVIVGDV